MSLELKKLKCLLLLAIGCVHVAIGQVPPPPPPPPGLVVPIDENIALLVVAGFLLGLYAVRSLAKRTKQAT